MTEHPDELPPKARLRAAGDPPWAHDLSGQTFASPDGLRLLSLEQAIRELDEQAASK